MTQRSMEIASGDGPAEINELHPSPQASSRKGGDCFGKTELLRGKKSRPWNLLYKFKATVKFMTCLNYFVKQLCSRTN